MAAKVYQSLHWKVWLTYSRWPIQATHPPLLAVLSRVILEDSWEFLLNQVSIWLQNAWHIFSNALEKLNELSLIQLRVQGLFCNSVYSWIFFFLWLDLQKEATSGESKFSLTAILGKSRQEKQEAPVYIASAVGNQREKNIGIWMVFLLVIQSLIPSQKNGTTNN